MSVSLSKDLCATTLQRLVDADGLKTVYERDLVGPMGPHPVGRIEILRGNKINKVVYIGLTVPQIGMDSHMVFAFTDESSAVPHFTLDSVQAVPHGAPAGTEPIMAFHLDLVPRAELASHLEYVNTVFEPLSDSFKRAGELFGASRADIGPRQYAMMSPWMLVNRTSAELFPQVGTFVNEYFDHWLALLESGLSADVLATLDDTDLAARDNRNRVNLFSREVDPVWDRVARLLGDEQTDELRAELISNESALEGN